jgi:hypothetical protein
MSARPKYMPEPRLFDREQAASYCGLSPDMFERCCPVAARRFGTGAHPPKRWDRVEIDKWLDSGASQLQSVPEWRDWLEAESANAR